MKFFARLSCLAALANAAVLDLTKRESSPLDVKIEMVGNTEVKASITNTGDAALKVLKTGSILDSLPIEKAEVFQGAEKVAFSGMRVYIETSEATAEDFQTIAAGEMVEVQFDVAEVHDLSAGGSFDISATGFLSYADFSPLDGTSASTSGNLEITGAASYASNVLTAQVDGAAAAKARRSWTESEKRTAIQSDCSTSQRSTISAALGVCRTYAANAASAASSGSDAKMTEYFKSATSSTRSTVAGVFSRAASDCSSSTGGYSSTYCTDRASACRGGVIAYTVPASSYIVYCSGWFSLPAQTSTCHGTDRPYVILHEATHLSQVGGTTDYNCYGYTCVRSLSASQNLRHADTYAQFANAIAVGC